MDPSKHFEGQGLLFFQLLAEEKFKKMESESECPNKNKLPYHSPKPTLFHLKRYRTLYIT